jgi:uncharacterized membrane protein
MKDEIYSKETGKILDNYLDRLKSKIKILPRSERQEILNEIRSDILAELHLEKEKDTDTQIGLLFSILEKLGKPEEVANEILSKKLISFRGNFFKRFFVFTGRSLLKALAGFFISFMSLILYFVGLLNFAMGFLKVFMPDKIGLFISDKGFSGYGFKMGSYDVAIGSITHLKGEEILGYWIIPLGMIVGLLTVAATNYLIIKQENFFNRIIFKRI